MPKAYLLAGQPGAGKTVLSSMLTKKENGNIVLVNADDYKRCHPRYNEICKKNGADTSKAASFANAVTDQLIEKQILR